MPKKDTDRNRSDAREPVETSIQNNPGDDDSFDEFLDPGTDEESRHLSESAASGTLVVGIGASAGGLRAFKDFLESMPAKNGIAFVLVPHLDPKHESMMVDLLSQRTKMSLREAEQGTHVEPDSVYVIPPNKYMEIRNGQLHLTPVQPPAGRTAIDRFFQSLAEDKQELAIGIVLSGTGSHGTPGLKEIKLAGGMVMVQDPQSADYPQMPQSAIDAGLADYIMSPRDMPQALISYARNPYVKKADLESGEDHLKPEMSRILAILRSRTHYDFRWYRKKMMLRRVRRRMGLVHIEDPSVYLNFLRDSPAEIEALYKDMLIGVTEFFREPEGFNLLDEQVLPELVAKSGGKTQVRVWVPGCSTGEEPYSIAMLLIEQFQSIGKPSNFQIFATDIDLDAIARAREGVYPESIAGDITPERLNRFFVQMGDHYQIRREIRDTVVFAPQNVISDAPFSRLDLISCRNLLIYLELPVQQRVISLFHFALREGGYLFLGASESVGRHTDLFDPLSKKWRIFRRVGPPRRDHQPTGLPLLSPKYTPVTLEPHAPAHLPLAEVMRRALLDTFAPASVLVNRKCEVLAFHGPATDYLEFPTGEPSRDLIALLRSGLRTKVRGTLQKAMRESAGVSTNGRVRRGALYVPCRIEVTPVREQIGLFLVAFQDYEESQEEARSFHVDESSLVTQLESDLKTTREDLQITIEELESSNEELKAANEEMMSMNEELQSANEELETSKEELQSLNEELTTVNNELSEKVEELDAAYTDLNDVLTHSHIATIFLDRDLRIRKFTMSSQKLFNVVPADIGRPLVDFSYRFSDPALLEDARRVLEHLSVSEAEVSTEDGKNFIRRILPYRTRYNRIEGVTITFVDISERKKHEAKLSEAYAGLEEQVSRRTAALSMIRDLAVQANAAQSVEEILEIAMRRICDYHGWVAAFAYTARPEDEDRDGHAPIVPGVSWMSEASRDSDRLRNAVAAAPLQPGKDLLGQAWTTGKAAWTTDLNRHLPVTIAEAAVIQHVESVYAYPISSGRNIVAMLLFMDRKAEEPGPRTLELLSSMANQISLVVERERLSRQIREMSAYEQVRLSQDLHDAIGQQLAGLSMSAEVISRTLAQKHSDEAPALAEVVQGLRETLQQIRLLARGLAEIPVGPGALAIALEQLCTNNPAVTHSSLECRTEVDRGVNVQDPDIAIHLYRIAQEAVHNAVTHSHGKSLLVSLKQDNHSLVLEIKDDGIGLSSTPRAGMGLKTMRHRARLIGGVLEVRNEQGTRIMVRVPKGDTP